MDALIDTLCHIMPWDIIGLTSSWLNTTWQDHSRADKDIHLPWDQTTHMTMLPRSKGWIKYMGERSLNFTVDPLSNIRPSKMPIKNSDRHNINRDNPWYKLKHTHFIMKKTIESQ